MLLTGRDLAIGDVVLVARAGVRIRADQKALDRVARGHELLLAAAARGTPIYGLSRGVAQDKEKPTLKSDHLDAESRAESQAFNRDLIHAHCAGIEPSAPEELVRAAMFTQLNTLLLGHSGAQPRVAELLVEFLNRRIHPVLPSRGSLGEADIAILSHLALAMIGEGDVIAEGTRVPARDALRTAGLEPLVPVAKDGLAILSSNAFTAGAAALAVYDAGHFLDNAELIAALSLEGLNGNIAPLSEAAQALRPYQPQLEAADRIRQHLASSFLHRPDPKRALQDPLSFRAASQVFGTARDRANAAEQKLTVQLNSSDDNPAVDLETGAVMPTANFEPLAWVLELEALSLSLRHVATGSLQRMLRLQDNSITGLRRGLAPDGKAMGLAMLQYPASALEAEVRSLSHAVSGDVAPVAGGIEDRATNAALVVDRLNRTLECLQRLAGLELIHAAQAVDLRRRLTPDTSLGHGTARLFAASRERLPFLDRDRVLSDDIEASFRFVQQLET